MQREIRQFLEENLKKAKKEMAACPTGKLIQENRDGKLLLFHSTVREDGKRTRRLLNKKPEILIGLLRKKYLCLEIAAMEKNIKYCHMMIKNFQSMAPDDIFEKIPTKFKHFPKGYFLESQKKTFGQVSHMRKAHISQKLKFIRLQEV